MGKNQTPWQRVFAKFGVPQSQLATALGRHRSKVSRAIKDKYGLISGRDQVALLAIAKEMGVDLTPADLMPGSQ